MERLHDMIFTFTTFKTMRQTLSASIQPSSSQRDTPGPLLCCKLWVGVHQFVRIARHGASLRYNFNETIYPFPHRATGTRVHTFARQQTHKYRHRRAEKSAAMEICVWKYACRVCVFVFEYLCCLALAWTSTRDRRIEILCAHVQCAILLLFAI